jgi:hypothetical protein
VTRKLMTSAFALTAVLALGVLPAAALTSPGGGGGGPGSGAGTNVEDSYNDNSSVDYDDSFNDNRENKSEVDVDDSYNDNSKIEDSNNDNREWKSETDVDDSYNDNSKIEDSYNSDSSTNDSNNDNSDNSTTNMRVAMSLQHLEASVSGFEFDIGGGGHRDDDGGSLRTGDISNSGGAFAGFAGIQTATYNTGFASTNQAATAISANANVTFGNGG